MTLSSTRYYGKVCAKHPEKNGERRKANRSCVACQNEKRVLLERRHPEPKDKKAARHKLYREKNQEKETAKMRAWRLANKERDYKNGVAHRKDRAEYHAARHKKYRTDNREKINRWAANHRALKLRAHVHWANDFFIEEAYRLAKLREKVCGGKWHVDHIVPLKSNLVCGLHVEDNLQVIPGSVNLSKSNRYWPDMPDFLGD